MDRCKIVQCDGRVYGRGLCRRHYLRMRSHGSVEGMRAPPGAHVQFIERHVDHQGTKCLIWPFGNLHRIGYRTIHLPGGATVQAHRYMCEMAHGPPPFPTAEAAHSCKNGRAGCVNPAHLRWDDRTGNMADTLRHGTRLMGEAHPFAKLSTDDVWAIFHAHNRHSDIAKAYGVARQTVSKIKAGRSWSWLTGAQKAKR